MIAINTVSEKYFTLDGIQFARIYQPLKQGLENVGVYSIYDTRKQLVNSTNYAEFEVDGTVFASQADAIDGILAVVYNAAYSSYVFDLEDRIGNLEENQYSGVVVYSTYAELPTTGTLLVSYKVSNDPDSALNGYYHWDGADYVKDADLANGIVEYGNTDPTSGGVVYNELEEIKEVVQLDASGDEFVFSDNFGNVISRINSSGMNAKKFNVRNSSGELIGVIDYDFFQNVLQLVGNAAVYGGGNYFEFADNSGNVVARIDENGIKAYQFIDKDDNVIGEPNKNGAFTIANQWFGKSLYSIADSFGVTGVWQEKIAELAGMVFYQSINYVDGSPETSLSVGGTSVSSASENGGQRRIKRLLAIDANPDYIIWENVNDINIVTEGDELTQNIEDYVPFMWEQDLEPVATVFASQSAARAYWDANYATILSGIATIDRKVGSTIVLNYTTDAIVIQVTSAATANGTYQFSIGGTIYSLAITAGMTIAEITAKIYEIAYVDYSKSTNNTDTVTLTYTGQSTVGVFAIVDTDGTGVVLYDSTSTSEGKVDIWFKSKDTADWETLAEWEQWKLNIYSWWKGLIEYVYETFPETRFFWLIPHRISVDFSASTYKRADGSWDIDAYKAADGRYNTLVTMQKRICEYYGVPVLDMTQTSNTNLINIETFGNNSNVHPKDIAYERWGETIVNLLK